MATFLLVHGAYQGGWIWMPAVDRLRKAGHQVYAPSLDGCAERHHLVRPDITVATHAQEIAQLMFYEDLHDVVLVGTSSGGMVVCKAAELARERIARLVFVDALALMTGEKVGDIVKRVSANETTLITTGPTRADLETRVFGDLEPELRAWARALHAPSDRGARGAGGARELLVTSLADDRHPLPARRESARGAPAPDGGAPQGRLARARHRPLSDAEPA